MADPNFIRRWRVGKGQPFHWSIGYNQNRIMDQIQASTLHEFRNQSSSYTQMSLPKSSISTSVPQIPQKAASIKPWHQRGLLPRVAKAQYRAANAVSKAVLGASIPQMGLVAGAIGGIGLLGAGLLGINAPAVAGAGVGAAVGFNEGYEAARARSRSMQDFQQSAQGLVFGLSNRRTA